MQINMNEKMYVACIVWSLCAVQVYSEEFKVEPNDIPEMELKPPDTQVVRYENETYIVQCGAGESRMRWLSPQYEWIEHHHGRIHIEHDVGKLTLAFNRITLNDSGIWTCEAERGNQKIQFNMVVHKPISFVDTPVVQSVEENETAVISCQVDGDPTPIISWLYNGEIIDDNSNKYMRTSEGLAIKRVTNNDSGEYTCKAYQISATINNVKEQTIRLNIQHKPRRLLKSYDYYYGYIKSFVNITCEAIAEPSAKFTWQRNAKQMPPISSQHQIFTSENQSVLQIYLNDSSALGDYVCEAKNHLGTLTRTIKLLNGTKPAAPRFIQLRGANSNTLDIDIGATRPSTPDLMDVLSYRFEIISLDEYRNNGNLWTNARAVEKVFTDGMTYVIDSLKPNATYLVRVASKNLAGMSDWCGPQNLTTTSKEQTRVAMPYNSANKNCLIDINLLSMMIILGVFLTISR